MLEAGLRQFSSVLASCYPQGPHFPHSPGTVSIFLSICLALFFFFPTSQKLNWQIIFYYLDNVRLYHPTAAGNKCLEKTDTVGFAHHGFSCLLSQVRWQVHILVHISQPLAHDTCHYPVCSETVGLGHGRCLWHEHKEQVGSKWAGQATHYTYTQKDTGEPTIIHVTEKAYVGRAEFA